MAIVAPTRPSDLTGATVALTTFVLCALFHFCQYAARSALGVMPPELSTSRGMTTAAIGSLIRRYYTYSPMSMVGGRASSAAKSAVVGGALARLGHAGSLHARQFRRWVRSVSLQSR